MPETRTSEAVGRRTVRRLPAGASKDLSYRPSYKPAAGDRSPYLTRPVESPVRVEDREEEYIEEDGLEFVEECVDKEGPDRVEMASKGDEGDARALLKRGRKKLGKPMKKRGELVRMPGG